MSASVPHKGYDCILDGLLYLGPECHAQTCLKDHYGKVTRIIRCKWESYDQETYMVKRAITDTSISGDGDKPEEERSQPPPPTAQGGGDTSENGEEKVSADENPADKLVEEEGDRKEDPSVAKDFAGKPMLKHGYYTWQPQVLHLPMTEGGRADVLNIEPYLPLVFKYIMEAEAAGEAVYVHCAVGVNRSATIVTSYIMHRNTWYMSKALEFVQSKRRVVSPDKSYLAQLEEFEERMFSGKENLKEREERKRLGKFDHNAHALTQLRAVAPDRSDEELSAVLAKHNWDVGVAASHLFF